MITAVGPSPKRCSVGATPTSFAIRREASKDSPCFVPWRSVLVRLRNATAHYAFGETPSARAETTRPTRHTSASNGWDLRRCPAKVHKLSCRTREKDNVRRSLPALNASVLKARQSGLLGGFVPGTKSNTPIIYVGRSFNGRIPRLHRGDESSILSPSTNIECGLSVPLLPFGSKLTRHCSGS